MASPQTENGYTKIANELLEAICKNPDINRGALGPVLYSIIRKTYGYQKKEDAISISQFVEMTGYSRRSVIYALQELEAKNVIFVKRHRGFVNDVNVVGLNKDYSTWLVQNSAPAVNKNRASAKLCTTSAKLRKKLVQNFAPTKENIQKKNTFSITKKGMDSFYEEKTIDEEGREISEGSKRKPRREPAMRLMRYYNNLCVKERGFDTKYSAGAYTMLCKVLDERDEGEVKDILDWYVETDKFSKNPQMTAALSAHSLMVYDEYTKKPNES